MPATVMEDLWDESDDYEQKIREKEWAKLRNKFGTVIHLTNNLNNFRLVTERQ